VSEELAKLPELLLSHLELSLFALLCGVSISIPLGIAARRRARLEHALLSVASVIQTVPSLALLALMVPLLAALGFPSIGRLPAFVALVLYSLLPILRNTVTGLTELDPAVLEAARGVGMTERQTLFRVELPLALPVIFAGVRTALVWTVGMATLSTPIGAPSLGNFIFGGLQTRNLASVLVGCIAAAALALLLDATAWVFARGLTQGRRGHVLSALCVFAALYAIAFSALAARLVRSDNATLTVGTKTFTEQYILGEILAAHIQKHTRTPVEVKQSLGSSVAFDALRSGQIDVYVDYSGTLWSNVLKRVRPPPTREQAITEITDFLEQNYGIKLVCPLGFENAYALAMRRKQAQELSIARISDLGARAARLSIGADYEFLSRPEWRALESTYGLKFREQRSMDPSLMYQAVEQADVDVISAFSSDGRIAAFDLVVLEDDRRVIPPYDAVILVSARFARESTAELASLSALCGTIDATRMRRMNLQVDQIGLTPERAALEFLASISGR
jgi:osmoprotectant transport system permease protein